MKSRWISMLWMVDMYPDMDAKTFRRIRSGWKVFTTPKNVFKAKLDKILRANLFNNSILPAMLYANEMGPTSKRKEQRLVTINRTMGKISAGKVVVRVHPRGCPRGVMVKVMDSGIVVIEFVLQSHYYVHFRANTVGKCMNPLILQAMG